MVMLIMLMMKISQVSEKSIAETKSKSNKHEAELCVWLCAYLLRQDYEESSVTIITAYSGQVLEIKRLLTSLNLLEGTMIMCFTVFVRAV